MFSNPERKLVDENKKLTEQGRDAVKLIQTGHKFRTSMKAILEERESELKKKDQLIDAEKQELENVSDALGQLKTSNLFAIDSTLMELNSTIEMDGVEKQGKEWINESPKTLKELAKRTANDLNDLVQSKNVRKKYILFGDDTQISRADKQFAFSVGALPYKLSNMQGNTSTRLQHIFYHEETGSSLIREATTESFVLANARALANNGEFDLLGFGIELSVELKTAMKDAFSNLQQNLPEVPIGIPLSAVSFKDDTQPNFLVRQVSKLRTFVGNRFFQ